MAELPEQLMVIDTDGGADDALAILLALDPRLASNWKVLAITTVHGNVDVNQATANVLRVLNLAKRTEIPVYKGASRPTYRDYKQRDRYGSDGLSGHADKYPLPKNCDAQDEGAIRVLMRLCRERPKQITIVCLGPLTNIACAHHYDKEFPENIKELFIMGGNLKAGNVDTCIEFNFLCDCEAAEIVFSKFKKCPKTVVTLEVCQGQPQTWDWFDAWTSKGTELSKFAGLVMESRADWRSRKLRQFCCCDLLAMSALINPSVVKKTRESSEACVEFKNKYTRGTMYLYKSMFFTDLTPNIILHTVYDMEKIRSMWDILTD